MPKAPVLPNSYFYSAVGSDPGGGGHKNACIFFLNRLFWVFLLS